MSVAKPVGWLLWLPHCSCLIVLCILFFRHSIGTEEQVVRRARVSMAVTPVTKQIDTLAAEFPAQTNYLYVTISCRLDHWITRSRHERTDPCAVQNWRFVMPMPPMCLNEQVHDVSWH